MADGCRGAHVAIDLAYEVPETEVVSRSQELLRACTAHGIRSVVLCSDALVRLGDESDVCDGDEEPNAGPSLIHEATAAASTSGRLGELADIEEALIKRQAGGAISGVVVVRLHRLYSSLPLGLPLLLGSGLGMLCGGARAQTNVLHVEDAAYGVVLAVDKTLDGFNGVETVVLTDSTVWSVHHLLRATAALLRLPPPLFPLLPLLRLLTAPLSHLPPPMRYASIHSYFTASHAAKVLHFSPPASSSAIHATLLAASERSGPALRFVPVLNLLAGSLVADACGAMWVALSLLLLAAFALFCAISPAPKSMPPQPPLPPPLVSGGSPLLGHLLQFVQGPVGMIFGLRDRYRSMFTIRVGHQRITFMIGQEAQLAFIKQKDDLLDQAPVYKFTIPVFGKGIVYDSPLEERLQQVKLLVHSMNTKSLEAMIPKMIHEAEEYFGAWGEEGTVELREAFSELIIMTASACLMGREVREELSSRIARIYHSLDGGLTPLSTMWPSAPTQKHKERDEARKEMVSIFSPIIAARRAGTIEDDFLQKIIDFRYKDEVDPRTGERRPGRQFTDSEVVGWLIVLLFAGQHTSSITSTWLGAMLLSHPEVLAEVKAEVEAKVPDEDSLTYANLLQMDAMRRSITEALRLYPPLILLMRKVMKHGFTVNQHTIPKGDIVGLCGPASNIDPRYWHDATSFKPSRFATDGPEKDTFDSYTVSHGLGMGFMLSFGGGAHMCSGRRFGYLQVSTIWAILLRDFDLELISKVPKPGYNDMVVGPDGPVMVKYRRKRRAKEPTGGSKSPAAPELHERSARSGETVEN